MFTDWPRKLLVDCDGKLIGKLLSIYVDAETNEPRFGTVQEGLLSRHVAFVPLTGVEVGPDHLRITVTRALVVSAPNLGEPGHELSPAEEDALIQHFALTDRTWLTPSRIAMP